MGSDVWSIYDATKNYDFLEDIFGTQDEFKVRFHQRLYASAVNQTACFNCGKIHSTCCEFPIYFSRCYRCLVISFDGSGHTSPCAPVNTISGIRSDIFVKTPLPLLKLRLKRSESTIHYLNLEDGRFKQFTDGKMLLVSATDGLFSFKESDNYNILSYDASSIKRMSFIVAVLSGNGYWRLRYRCVLTTIHGLLLFKLRSTLQMQNGRFILPPEYKSNTTFVLGIKPEAFSVKMDFRIFANENGIIDQRIFNGYTSSATWVAASETDQECVHIDDAIDGEKVKVKRLFDHRLKEAHPQAVASFRSQRLDSPQNE